MKTISKILSFIFIAIFVISCSLSEEITFNTNGSIHYNFVIDGSNLTKILPDSTKGENKKVRDSIIYFSRLLDEKKDSIALLPLEQQKKLMALRPITVRLHDDKENKEFLIEVTGDFDNSNSLTSGLNALNEFSGNPQRGNEERMGLMTHTQYEWDGKTLKKYSTPVKITESDSITKNLALMFGGGKFKVKYNFPKKILKVNDPNALISQDGKSVLIEYEADKYITSPEITDLIVEIED